MLPSTWLKSASLKGCFQSCFDPGARRKYLCKFYTHHKTESFSLQAGSPSLGKYLFAKACSLVGYNTKRQRERYEEQAAHLGDMLAASRLATEKLKVVPFEHHLYRKNIYEGIRILEGAAAGGDVNSEYLFAVKIRNFNLDTHTSAYYRIVDIETDLRKSFYYMKSAASKGHLMSRYLLGVIYLGGDKAVEQNPQIALQHFQSAFENHTLTPFGYCTNTLDRYAILASKTVFSILSVKEASIRSKSKQDYLDVVHRAYYLLEHVIKGAEILSNEPGQDQPFLNSCFSVANCWIDCLSETLMDEASEKEANENP
eukprot:Sdes_comp20218_c0_seq1m13584